ncbi:hypothetical protein K5J60_004076 [Salmonella enterica]|nr:hypothetical protein [Salmonella enterica]ECC3883427.1 hypothetical protein [Salmonella enterica subsp. diarizonae]EFO9812327.1 hypothetical protein [Salmonella enterica subsp. enterica serovar Enteritidis]EIE2749544.1 hypothetical protein [Salmonella enterica subsp. diarizonae serovar 48:i:z]ECJ4780220.1 hypothetical protein [Salmonella enterica subsp. diarizonae]
MAKIQARNVDDALFARIEQSAMKNERSLEGEIRLALATLYPATDPSQNIVPLSMRERWQQETGQRLRWLLQRLNEDGFGTRARTGDETVADYVRLGDQLGTSPGLLMDIAEGRAEMTPEMAAALQHWCGASGDWLLSGEGESFPVVKLGTCSGVSWQEFFFPDDDDRYVFEFIRIGGGRHEGTLLILRRHEHSGRATTGLVTEAFYLRAGMGNGGYGNLKNFLLFLKQHCGSLVMNAYQFMPPDLDFDFWSVTGRHHPVWFHDINRCLPSRWLQQLLGGEDPGEWFTGDWSPVLKEIAEAAAGEQHDPAG